MVSPALSSSHTANGSHSSTVSSGARYSSSSSSSMYAAVTVSVPGSDIITHYPVPGGCHCCQRTLRRSTIGGGGGAESCSSMVRSHKSYMALVFVPYLFLVLIFHTQLQVYDTGGGGSNAGDGDSLGRGGRRAVLLQEEGAFIGQQGTYHLRDLMLKQHMRKQGHDRYMAAAAAGAPSINDTIPKFFPPHSTSKSKSVIASSSDHIKQLLDLDRQAELDAAGEKRMFQSQRNRTGSNSPWNSAYPMSARCHNAPVVADIPYVHYRPLLNHWLYTAYYDDRGPESPQVRVIALFRKIDRPAVFCHFPKTAQARQADDFISVMPDYYEMCENHAKDYGGWILSCKVPTQLIDPPCEVTVSIHSLYRPEAKDNIRIPVFMTEAPSKQDFGVCIPPIFGYIPSTTLVEFIEMTRLLGASHLVFYAHQASREIQKVLRYYDQQDVLTVINWNLPVKDKQIWYHGQLLAINDCLYRNMHRFNYIAFNDLDEFIVPHSPGARNWTDMIKAIEQVASQQQSDPQLHCGYSFHSAFFDPLSSGSRVLYDLESDLRTKSLSTVRTKTMVRPDKMFELGIHHMSRPISDKFQAYYVMPSEAYIHHYRKCVTDFDPKMNCQVYARDETLSPYIPSLRHNVHQALWTLKEREKLHT